MHLKEITVIVLDCQATGASPDKGSLLELGWARASSSCSNGIKPRIRSYLLQLDNEDEIPRRVKRITGISEEDLKKAEPAADIWDRLQSTVKGVNRENRLSICPVVIHFARYEKKFLQDLHRKFSPEKKFPFRIICTYEIVRRLLPELPRKGLRAAAGFLGYSVEEMRRTGYHVPATIFIWRELVSRLTGDHKIKTLDELDHWIEKTKPGAALSRTFPMERELRLKLPPAPGVYRMCRGNGDIVYIGKATNLKQRVNSYWQKRSFQDEKTIEMLTQVRSLKVTQTVTSLEAALLESDEIKLKAPPYNIALRDKERSVRFLSRDLKKSSDFSAPGFPIGPVISEQMFLSISTLADLITTDSKIIYNRELRKKILGISDQYAPEMILFKHGINMFIKKHSGLINTGSLGGLWRIGYLLRKEKLLRSSIIKDLDNLTEDKEDENNEIEKSGWTPEKICRFIESNIINGIESVRKSRWYSIVSESAISWDIKNKKSGTRRLIVLKNGRIVSRETLNKGDITPSPSGTGKDRYVKMKNFDLITYDRMRVLTTELRRLSSGSRNVEIRLSNLGVITPDKLETVLSFI